MGDVGCQLLNKSQYLKELVVDSSLEDTLHSTKNNNNNKTAIKIIKGCLLPVQR